MATQVDVDPEVVAQEGQDLQTASLQEPQGQQAENADADRNWKQAREVIEGQKRQLKLAEEREREYLEQLRRLSQPQKAAAEPEEIYNDDDVLTVKQAKKLAQKEAQRLLREQEDSMGEDLARREFGDYDRVVTPENLERLKRDKPKLFSTIAENPSLYGKASTAYALLKNLVGSTEDQQASARLKENAAKPRSTHSVGADRPLHQAHNFENGLTPDLKKQLWKEMQDLRKNY